MKKVLIVGGVAGGASTATRLRRLNEDLEIILFEKGQHVSFANCGLPYHIGGVIENRESLLVQTPESLKERFNLDIRVNSEVISVNSQEKSVMVKTKNGEEYKESFDYLVLAPGAKPLVPPIDGIGGKNIYTLRNVTDLDKIMEKIKSVKEAIVIGGGFIGVEVAENLQEIGITTTLIEAAPNILAPFDSEMSNILEAQLANNGINLLTNNKVIKFQNEDEEVLVSLENGNVIKGDIVILAIGVSPDTKFLNNSGINLGERGHILVNEHLETNIKDIYALGDAILVKHFVTGQDVAIALAGPANRQGRIVAGNISGKDEIYKGSFGTSIIKVFNLTGGATGLNERSLKSLGKNFEKIYLHPNDHAGYYPGATPISIKLLYEKETKKVLGAQAVGLNGVDKFIDVIATVLKFRGTIDDLSELDLAYSPPYSSAKSPANMSGFIGQNIEDGLIEQSYVEDLENFDREKQIILDVREELELIGGKFENSINIPLSQLRKRFSELPKDKEILTYCAVGLRGYIASRFLISKGYKVKNIAGGFKSKLSEIKVSKKEINNEIKNDNNTPIDEKDYLNLSGLSCPGPLVKIKNKIDELNQDDILKVKVTDPGFYNDIQSWAKVTKNRLVELKKQDKTIYATLQKGLGNEINSNNKENKIIETNDAMTIVVFSGELDKAIAAFIIANGALAMGKKVTMFFTFWGLSILRKKSLPNKSSLEKMFDMMLPKNSKGLPLSKMNFFGMGSKMIRDIMNRKNIMSLEELMKKSIEDGANLVACTMSMDVMGIKEEELVDGISFGGVGQYLGEADKSNNNLFI
ncbi:FAD-dependent oxidoreductase [Fusobacterium perfoetens]|uniref:FAD-dependent oxidoreductase n=1 Tax=Fusobacterium perfoetens TaxID=852 RepID=UPI001F418DDD|nr:FAD-dependent oxidoreductase [Fusobacterium perfoetens]MCF2612727.1 FAD-dependent oxidoreductase [Fusobacterium perfoetens]